MASETEAGVIVCFRKERYLRENMVLLDFYGYMRTCWSWLSNFRYEASTHVNALVFRKLRSDASTCTYIPFYLGKFKILVEPVINREKYFNFPTNRQFSIRWKSCHL